MGFTGTLQRQDPINAATFLEIVQPNPSKSYELYDCWNGRGIIDQ